MKKIKQLTQTIVAEYSKRVKKTKDPKIVYSFDNIANGDCFSSHYAAGVVHLNAETPLAAAHGLSLLSVAIKSGHLAEFLGEYHPRCPLRPLWIGCETPIAFTPQVGIHLPKSLKDRLQLEKFCSRLIELGYNAVLLGSRENAFHSPSEELMKEMSKQASVMNLTEIISIFHDFGLKVMIKPNIFISIEQRIFGRCPLNTDYKNLISQSLNDLFQHVPIFDYLFWEGQFVHPDFYHHNSAYDATQLDLICGEIKMLENLIAKNKTSLIYFSPVQDISMGQKQAAWLSRLSDEVGNQTILAFSAVAGDPCADHLPPHPFWAEIRQSPDTSSTQLMPIVNIGAVGQGEGLWPALTLDLVDHYFTRFHRHRFAGAIVLVNRLPMEGALLDCNLWVAAQSLLKERSALLLAETWFSAHRSDWNFPHSLDLFKSIRAIVVELSFLRSLKSEKNRDIFSSEECRTVAESLLWRLKQLRLKLDRENKTRKVIPEHPSCSDYFRYFMRDARRIVIHFLHCFHVSLPSMVGNEDAEEGFWVQVSQQNHVGKPGGNMIFLEQPQRGAPGGQMERIYEENRL